MKRLLWTTSLVAALVIASCGTSNKSSFTSGGGPGRDGGGSSGSGDGSSSFGDDGSTPPSATAATQRPRARSPSTIAPARSSAVDGHVAAGRRSRRSRDGVALSLRQAPSSPAASPRPVLQWTPQSGGADGVYVHLHSSLFDYKGCFGATSPQQLPVPDTAWTTAWAQSSGASDPLTVELTTIVGTTVSGPITEAWTFALGSLKGVVYYNTYTSPQVNNNGAVMVIQPGASKPTPFLVVAGMSPTGPCISCHSRLGERRDDRRAAPPVPGGPHPERVVQPAADADAEPGVAARDGQDRRLGLQRGLPRRLAAAHGRTARA